MARFVPTKETVGMAEPKLDESVSCMVAVSNCPVVGPEKYDKLCSVLRRVLARAGALADHEAAVYMPVDEAGQTKGVVFAEYADEKSVAEAKAKVDGLRLDSAHVLAVHPVSQFVATRDVPDAYVPAAGAARPWVAREDDVRWLEDAAVVRGCEMYATHIAADTTIALFNPRTPDTAQPVFARNRFSDVGIRWSPRGTYFVTMHSQGAMLWQATAQELAREPTAKIALPNVNRVLFSPRERFVLVWRSNGNNSGGNGKATATLYDVASRAPVAKLPVPDDDRSAWEWAADEKFCVRRHGKAGLEVYDVERRAVRHVPLRGVAAVALSPAAPVAACYVPGDSPAAQRDAWVTLLDVTTGATVRTYNVHSCLACELYWHPSGAYLAARVDSPAKGARVVSSLVLFRAAEKGCPTEVVDAQNERITAVAWEPALGTRLAYASTSAAETAASYGHRGRVVVVDMRGPGQRSARTAALDPPHPCAVLAWAPQQGVLVLADTGVSECALEFYAVDSNEVLASTTAFNVTSVAWDPAGRHLAAIAAAAPGRVGDTGYSLFSVTGTLVHKVTTMNFNQFVWRPRPPCALAADKLRSIRDNLAAYRAQFRRDEEAEARRLREAAREKLNAKSREFQTIMASLLAIYDAEADSRRALSNGFDPADPDLFTVSAKSTQVVLGSKI